MKLLIFIAAIAFSSVCGLELMKDPADLDELFAIDEPKLIEDTADLDEGFAIDGPKYKKDLDELVKVVHEDRDILFSFFAQCFEEHRYDPHQLILECMTDKIAEEDKYTDIDPYLVESLTENLIECVEDYDTPGELERELIKCFEN